MLFILEFLLIVLALAICVGILAMTICYGVVFLSNICERIAEKAENHSDLVLEYLESINLKS